MKTRHLNRWLASMITSLLLALAVCGPVFALNGFFTSDCNSILEPKSVFDKNEPICVSGSLQGTYSFPAICADVYIMDNRIWSGGETLADAMGSENRVCTQLGGSAVFEEHIAFPGKIKVGKFDLVTDADMNGKFDPAIDEVDDPGLSYGFEVRDFGHPPVDASAVATLKQGAHDISTGYSNSISQIGSFCDALNVLGIGLSLWSGDPLGAAIGAFGLVTGIPTSYNDWAISQGQKLIGAFDPNKTPQEASGIYGNVAKKWYDLYEDPADANYKVFATLDFAGVNAELAAASVPGSYPFSMKGSDPREAALIELANRSVEQAAIVKALRVSYEKYQGAYAVSDYEYSYRQLEMVRYFAGLLTDNLTATKLALQWYRDAMAAAGQNTFVYDVSMMQALKARVTTYGLSADEIASLKGVGFSDAQVALVESYVKAMKIPAESYTTDSALNAQIDLVAPMIQAVQGFAAAAQSAMVTLAAEFTPHYPKANAGGPYTGLIGTQIMLDGSGSTDPDVADTLTYAWDLNNDGLFDDASGKTVLRTWEKPFTGLVGLRVTDGSGNSSVAYGKITVTSANHPPAITFTPAASSPRVSVSTPGTFSVVATDPDGDSLSYEWTVDGAVVSTGTNYTFTPPPATKGTKRLMVTVRDGKGAQAVEGRIVTMYLDCDPGDDTTKNTYYLDADNDTFGDPAAKTLACTPPSGYVTNSLDCDDSDRSTGKATATFYLDADGDGFGSPAGGKIACTAPAGYVTNTLDCDDGNATVGKASTSFYRDADGDSFGDPASSIVACSAPAGYVANSADCNDTSAAIGNTLATYYRDADGDGFGDPGSAVQACLQPAGTVTNALDCNDANPFAHRGAREFPNNVIDEDCSSATPDNWSKTFALGLDDSGWIYYAKSNGDGTFSNYHTLGYADASYSRGIVIDDFNGDGYLDFIVGNGNGSLILFTNDGNDNFTKKGVVGTHPNHGGWIMDLAAGDFNNDGFPDLVANGNSNVTAVFLSDGKGGFTRTTITTSYTGRGLDAGDFNGDGNLDFAISFSGTNDTWVYRGDGTGKFTGAPVGTATSSASDNYALAAADFDNDGKLDLIVSGSSNGDAFIFKGKGDGSFQAGVYVGSADVGTHSSIDAYDFNNDGNADIVQTDYYNRRFLFYPGKGDGTFAPPVQLGTSSNNFLSVSAPPYLTRAPGFPVAVAYPKEGTAAVGSSAGLDGSFSYAAQGGITSFGWNFGDGATGAGAKPAHPYAAEGSYRALLTVTDDAGHKAVDAAQVKALGAPPVANAGGPYTVGEAAASNARYSVTLDGSGSSDDAGIASYDWDFGDGFSDDFSDGNSTGWTPAQGTWSVVDGGYRQSNINIDRSDSFTGNPKGGDYTVEADIMLLAGTGQEVQLLFRGADKDNHYEFIFRGRGYNDVLFYKIQNGSSWNLASAPLGFAPKLNTWYHLKVDASGSNFKCYVDGAQLLTVTDATHPAGRVGFSTYYSDARFDNLSVTSRGSGAKPTHLYPEGSYTARLKVTDKAGQSSTATTTVQAVKGNPPVAIPGGPYTFGENVVNSNRWSVTLDGSASTDDTGIESYFWDFGDNSTGTGAKPSHVYTGARTYTVTLTVTDRSGLTSTATTTVTTKGNTLPQAKPGGPYLVDEKGASAGQWTVSFDGRSSTDDFGIYDYYWTFGDGGGAGGATPTHSYAAAGTYTVTLTVRDHAMQSHSATTIATVSVNALPVSRPGGTYTVDEGAAKDGKWTVTFDGSSSSDDYGIWKYDWNFGDGTTGSGAKPVHLYPAAGTYTATLTVTDNGRQTNSSSTTVTVAGNNAPVAEAGAGKVTEVGFPATLSAAASTDDFGIRSYHWSFDLPTWSYSGIERIGDEALVWGDGSTWTARYLVSDTLFTRKAGESYTGRVTLTGNGSGNRYMMWGLKNSTADNNHTQFYHAIYFENGNVNIYELGNNRGKYGTYTDNASYDLRIDTKSSGAIYYYRPAGTSSWTKLYESANYNGTPLRVGATVHSGLVSLGAFSTPQGALQLPPASVTEKSAVSATFNTPGTYTATVKVTDHASQSSTDSTTVTVVAGEAPVASSGGPYLTNEDVPTRFNARGSTDDFGIRFYQWDFGDGEGITTRNPWVDHRYTRSGVYTVTLTVTDYAGHSATDTTTATVTADPVVACVPWQFSGASEMPHDAWSGKEITLKGAAWSLQTPLTYKWEFGDGTPPVSGTVADKRAIEAKHTYTGVDGQPFTATLTVTDANGKSSSDQYLVRLRAKSIDVEVNVSIDEGLWWLHVNQNRSSFAKGVSDNAVIDSGYWDNSGGYNSDSGGVSGLYTSSPTASAIQAFQVNGHLELGDVRRDPYVETVARGLRFTSSRLTPASIGVQTYGDPDTNGNGIGVQTVDGRPIYEMGQVMDSIVSSGSPYSYPITGPAGVKGRSYFDLVTDMVDMYSWGQTDHTSSYGGGWRYSWNSDSDNSAAQWAAIGMLAAEEVWKIQAPRWVKERNDVWMTYTWDGTGFGYSGPGNGTNTTPSGLVQLAFDDVVGYDDPATTQDERDPRWKTAEAYIANNWSGNWWYPNYSLNNRFTYYGYYAFTKAMRSAKPKPVVNLKATGLDWYKDSTRGVARRLIDRQQTNGSWPQDSDPGWYVGYDLTTAWSVIILTPTLFVQPPVADAGEDRVWGVDVPLTLDGSRSYHLDPFRKIVQYEWDLDGDGTFDTKGSDPKTSHIYTREKYPESALPKVVTVTLRVTDDNDPPKSSTDSAKITIAVPPHPPVADAGGPYRCFTGVPCQLDGGASFDIDPTDTITSYEWDINGDRSYGDLTGEKAAAVFTTLGMKNVGLKVADNGVMNNGVRLEAFAFTTVDVATNRAPAANAGGPYTVAEGSSLQIDGGASADPDGNALTYAWDLDNDGTFETTGTTRPFSRPDNGTFTVRLKVSDGGLESSSTATVIVTNVPPAVLQPATGSINEGGSYTAGGSFTDPGADTWSATVDYGDGSGVHPLTLSGKGFNLSHLYAQSGTYTVTVVVTDKDGGAGTGTTVVTVGNVAPVVNAGPDATLNETRSFTSAGSFTDPGGDSWTATVNYGDGTGVHPVTLTAAKTFALSHTYAVNGVFTVTVTVRDSDGATGTDTAQVTINNRAPAVNAGPDAAIAEGGTFTSGGSFSDPGSTSWTATVNYGDGSATVPLALSADGTFKLSHVYLQDGVYNVTVSVTDKDNGTGSDSATVTVGNVAPAVNAGPDAAIAAGGTFSSSGSFTDPGADSWTGSVDYGDGSGVQSLAVRGDKSFPLSHTYAAQGSYTVTVSVRENSGATGTDTAVVTVAVPSCLTTLVARAKTTQVQLNWGASEHTPTTRYDIYRSTNPAAGFTKIRSGYTNTYAVFLDTGLVNGTTYYYRIEKSLAPAAGYCSSKVVSAKPFSLF